jgi:starch-binding outer membrane protein, SusD/RagB family
MKKYKSLLLGMLGLCLLSALTSCKKDLEKVVPQDAISLSSVLTDAGAAQTLYTGVYSDLRTFMPTLYNLGEMRSDIWADGTTGEAADATSKQYYSQNISALNVPAGNWAGFYNLLYQVNTVIKVFPSGPLPAAQRDRELAEMYGIRAYIYYTMMKTWGAVPLTTEPLTTVANAAQTYKARTSADSILIQIKSDIEKSLTLFNGDNSFITGNRVYWNRVATLVLKGDVYIWSGTLMGGGTADLTTAKNALQEIENLQGPTLKLDANYADIFDPTKKSNNPEIIFALSYELQQAQNNYFQQLFTVNGAVALGLSFSPTVGAPTVAQSLPFVQGANRLDFTPAMLARLTSGPPDQRLTSTFKIMYKAGTSVIVGEMLTKWIGVVNGSSQLYNNDYPIYRYADVLLLMAEAKAKLGQDPSPEINQIRARAYGAAAVPYVNSSIDANMNAILEENLREFIGEGKRWWALRRAGDQYVYNNVPLLSSTSAAKLVLPITVSMLNNDPLLKQTTGY